MDPITQSFPRRQHVIPFLTGMLFLIALLAMYFLGKSSLVKLGAVAFVGSAAGLVILAYPRLGLYALVFYIFSGVGIYLSFVIAQPLLALSLVAAGLVILGGDRVRFDNRLFNWSLAWFALIAVTSILWARNPVMSLNHLLKLGLMLSLVFLILQLIKSPRDLERYSAVIFYSALLSVILGVINIMIGFTTDVMILGVTRLIRFPGTHINPNALGNILTIALPLGFYQIKRAPTVAGRVLASVAVLLTALAVLASYSRGAMFPLAFLLLATLFHEVRSKLAYLSIAALVLLIYLLTPAFYWERISTVTEIGEMVQRDNSIWARVLAAKSALSLISRYPLTGVGVNNFMARSSPELRGLINVHNGYLELLVGVGIFGFTAWAGMVYAALRDCYLCMKAEWDGIPVKMRSLAFYLMVSSIAGLLGNLFNSSQFDFPLWISLAGGLAAGNMLRNRRGRSAQ